jgi:outer membrane protein assembly factor BamB
MATSIVFPAFDAPLVADDVILAHHTSGERLICLDRKTGAVRWQIKATAPIWSTYRVDSNRIAAVHADKVSMIETSRGTSLKTEDIAGVFFGRSTDGYILSKTRNDAVVCSDLDTGKRVWKRQCRERNSNVMPIIVDDFMFLAFSPRTISMHSDGKSKGVTMKGTNLVTCFSAKTGTPLWEEPVPLSRKGFGVHLQVAASQKWLLCTTDNALRLLDRKSGKILSRWRSEEDIDGADFWGDGLIAVCIGGIGASTRTIRTLNASDLTLNAEFAVDAVEVASVKVVGDVMVLHSFYRNIGVDLRSQIVIWRKGQRHCTVQSGLLYFGEHADNKRVLGVCDPKTGRDTVIYSETVENQPKAVQNENVSIYSFSAAEYTLS